MNLPEISNTIPLPTKFALPSDITSNRPPGLSSTSSKISETEKSSHTHKPNSSFSDREMDSSYFNRWYQQPDTRRRPFSPSPSFRGVPVYPVDPTRNTHRPSNPTQQPKAAGQKVVQIPVHYVGSETENRPSSALKIQKVFRGFLVRKSVKKVQDIKAQVDEIEGKLSRSEIVELIQRDERERLRMNESLMALLFKLDSIRGIDSGVRDFRKAVIRKAIALQERVDAIADVDLVESIEEEVRVSGESENSNQLVDFPTKLGKCVEVSGDEDKIEEGCVEIPEMLDGEDVNGVGGGENHTKKEIEDEVKGNEDGEIEIVDVGVDREVKVSERNSLHENLDVENLKGSLIEKEEKGGDWVEVGDGEKGKEGNREEEGSRRNCELMEKMIKDNEKMMGLMMQLAEKNEMQTKMINALTHRVELLEKAFVCDRLRKKKKKAAAASRRED